MAIKCMVLWCGLCSRLIFWISERTVEKEENQAGCDTRRVYVTTAIFGYISEQAS